MMLDGACCEIEDGSLVSRKEFGKSFSVKNGSRKRIKVCRVDGCLITGSATRKCDYLFILDEENVQKFILVELKGSDHIHAIDQIVEAAEQLKLNQRRVEVDSYIVGSPNPKANTKVQKHLARSVARYKRAGVKIPVIRSDTHTVNWP